MTSINVIHRSKSPAGNNALDAHRFPDGCAAGIDSVVASLLIGGEGDVFRGRYKVKRVGLTSIVVEDMEYSEEQTLPITAPKS